MINVIFSKLITTPYATNELQNMSFSERKIITDFNYERLIDTEQIEVENFHDIVEIRQKVIDLCMKHDPKPIILVMPNYSLDSSYLIGKEYKSDDPDAIFESLIFKHEHGNVIEIVRLIGRNLNNVLRYISEYAKLYKLTGKLQWNTNLIREEQKMVYDGTK